MSYNRVNKKVDWWLYREDDGHMLRVSPIPCPLELTFDNTLFTFDSTCFVFDLGVDSGFTFDSTDYLFSSEYALFDYEGE